MSSAANLVILMMFQQTPSSPPSPSSMASFKTELDPGSSIVLVVITEDDGSDHDYQFDFDPKTGRWEFAERDLLERDFGEEWVDEMVESVQTLIDGAVSQG
jgi:hypothetical protein